MNIIITGASRGIGYDTALQLAADPANQLLVLSRKEEKLQALQKAAKVTNPESQLEYLCYDLVNPDQDALLEKIKNWKQVDILINNAGLLISKPFQDLTMADWQNLFSVNLFGVAAIVKVLLPKLEASEHAHIVNVGSMGGFQGSAKFPGLSAYSASKAALANLTECLAEELKDKNISANCLAIGAVQTEMLASAFPGYQAPVSSEQMASFFAYFATKGHQFYNGKVLPVSVSTP